MIANKEWVEMKKAGRGWRREFLDAFRDIPSSVVEPIMNSVDSYEEKSEKDKSKESQIIFVEYGAVGNKRNRKGYCRTMDFAVGIPGNELRERFEFHEAPTSSRLTKGIRKGGGWKGVGAKDTLMFHAWESKVTQAAKVTSFFGGQYSQIEAKFDDKEDKPKLRYTIFNEKITPEIKKKYKLDMHDTGTIIEFPLGPNAPKIDFDEFKDKIKQHFRLRKVLASDKFRVSVQNYYNPKEIEELRYVYPEVEEELYNNEIEIQLNDKEIKEFQQKIWDLRKKDEKYKKMVTEEDLDLLHQGKFRIHLIIWKSKEPLDHSKTSPYREGILVYHDNYSILDCTLFGWERKTKLSNYLLGEAEILNGINILIALEDAGISLVDKKRKGLQSDNYFNQKLLEKVDDILKDIHEKYKFETIKESLGEERELKKALKEINDDLKNEINPLGEGVGITPPDEGLRFYETYSVSSESSKPLNLKQIEPKGVLLAVNTNKIIKPDDILIESDEDIEVYVKRKIHPGSYPNLEIWHLLLTGTEICENKKIKASYKEFEDSIIVNVKENEKLEYDFKFFPSDFLITVDIEEKEENEKKKNILLIMKKDIFSSSRPILLKLKNNVGEIVSCPTHIDIKKVKELSKNILMFRVPVSVKYQKNIILPCRVELIAEYKIKLFGSYKTSAKINIDKKGTRRPKGFIHDILPDYEKSSYDDARIEGGILYLHMWHPTLNPDSSDVDLDTIKANAAARCIITHLLELRGYLGEDQPADEFRAEYDVKYEKYGKKWQEALLKSFIKKKIE